MNLDFNSLYDSARGGDAAARDELFEQLSVRFRLFANLRVWNPHDAEEVVQEALLTISREYLVLQVTDSFAAWAYKVLDNRILTYIRSKKRRSSVEQSSDTTEQTEPGVHDADPTLRLVLSDCLRKLREANQRYARVVALHYQGYTTAEVCQMLEVSSENLYMILSRARAMLKECLKKGGVLL